MTYRLTHPLAEPRCKSRRLWPTGRTRIRWSGMKEIEHRCSCCDQVEWLGHYQLDVPVPEETP